MSSISPDYSKDGETYSDMKNRMESVFAEHEQVKFDLQDIRVSLAEESAKATSRYTLQYESSAKTSGVLVFELSQATGHWKITRIDSK